MTQSRLIRYARFSIGRDRDNNVSVLRARAPLCEPEREARKWATLETDEQVNGRKSG